MSSQFAIGLDIGHGETSACAVNLTTDSQPEPLCLTENRATVIPSAIAYDSGGPLVGFQAAARDNVVCYFKTPPAEWADKSGKPLDCNGESVKDGGIGVRDFMRDFIRVVYCDILRYNEQLLSGDDEIFLYVGCPASSVWAGNAYQELIREATGLDSLHVSVYPESVAAVFNALMSYNGKLRADDGVVVFDFGSTTADFAYLLMGKTAIERSWTLGASKIEKNMLRCLLDEKFQEGKVADKDIVFINKIWLELRRFKERYYSGELAPEAPIAVKPTVKLSKTSATSADDKPLMKAVTLIAESAEELMGRADSEIKFPVSESGRQKGVYAWQNACESFMLEMRGLLERGKCPYKSVTLTGGASRMRFVKEIAGRVFAGKNVYAEDNPSITVAKGLCVIGKTDSKLPRLATALAEGVISERQACFKRDVIQPSAHEMAVITFDAALDALEATRSFITAHGLEERVKDRVRIALNGGKIKEIVSRYLDAWTKETQKQIIAEVNRMSENLYRGLLQPGAISVQPDALTAGMREINTDSVTRGSFSVYSSSFDVFLTYLDALSEGLLGAIMGVILFIVLAPLFLIGGSSMDLVMEAAPVLPSAIRKAANRLRNERYEKIREFEEKFFEQLQCALDTNAIAAPFAAEARNALDVAALKRFQSRDAV